MTASFVFREKHRTPMAKMKKMMVPRAGRRAEPLPFSYIANWNTNSTALWKTVQPFPIKRSIPLDVPIVAQQQ